MSNRRFPIPVGDVSRRLHGIQRSLEELSASARRTARGLDEAGKPEFAASLRGKAAAYDEARLMIRALDRGWRLPRWKRWTA